MTYDHFLSWTSGGATVSVGRNCESGESSTECERRFNQAVAVLKALFPVDP